jgi:hypothetical protein
MAVGAVVLVDRGLGEEALDGWKAAAGQFSSALGTAVRVITGDEAALTTLTSQLAAQADRWTVEALAAGADAPPPMTAAPFEYDDAGRPAWDRMWTSFCELALYGGPPHRGPDDPVSAGIRLELLDDPTFDAVAEIRRGIFQTTALFAEPAEPGWLAVTCDDPRMAAWLCASIILENVDARCEGDRLLVPAQPGFRLKNEVKSVVTVVAKTHHYWQAHLAAVRAVAG